MMQVYMRVAEPSQASLDAAFAELADELCCDSAIFLAATAEQGECL